MEYDYWACAGIAHQDERVQQQAIEGLLDKKPFPDQLRHLVQVSDQAARIQLLAQALVTRHKDFARSGTRQSPGGVAELYTQGRFDAYLSEQHTTYLLPLGLTPALPDLTRFPAYSTALTLTFTLSAPYISKDDAILHIFDNPVRKEKVFQVPMLAATGWKGALRATMTQQLNAWWSSLDDTAKAARDNRRRFVAWRLQLARLFGTELGVQLDDDIGEHYLDKQGGADLARWYRRCVRRFMAANGFFAGRLHFFPSFFNRIGLEVINPHNRETGAGTQPIVIETVPAGAQGEFTLLYVPFNVFGNDRQRARQQLANDLELLTEGLHAMLTLYGFGAKTSSGFGVAADQLASEGKLLLRAALPTTTVDPVAPAAPDLPRYLETPTRLHPDFRQADGSLKSAAEYEAFIKSQGQQYGKKEQQLYEKAQKWWERESRQLAATAATEPLAEPAPAAPATPAVTELTFASLSALREHAQRVAAQLRSGGEG